MWFPKCSFFLAKTTFYTFITPYLFYSYVVIFWVSPLQYLGRSNKIFTFMSFWQYLTIILYPIIVTLNSFILRSFNDCIYNTYVHLCFHGQLLLKIQPINMRYITLGFRKKLCFLRVNSRIQYCFQSDCFICY